MPGRGHEKHHHPGAKLPAVLDHLVEADLILKLLWDPDRSVPRFTPVLSKNRVLPYETGAGMQGKKIHKMLPVSHLWITL
jgi:hypothetical protein